MNPSPFHNRSVALFAFIGAVLMPLSEAAAFRVVHGQGKFWCGSFHTGAFCDEVDQRCMRRDCTVDRGCTDVPVGVKCGAQAEFSYKNHYNKFAPIVKLRSDEIETMHESERAIMGDCPSLFGAFKPSNFADLIREGPEVQVPDTYKCDMGSLLITAGTPEVLHAFTQLVFHSPMGHKINLGGMGFGNSNDYDLLNRIVELPGYPSTYLTKPHLFHLFALKALVGTGHFKAPHENERSLQLSPESALRMARHLDLEAAGEELSNGLALWILDLIAVKRQRKSMRADRRGSRFLWSIVEPSCDEETFFSQASGLIDTSHRYSRNAGEKLGGPVVAALVKDLLASAIEKVKPPFVHPVMPYPRLRNLGLGDTDLARQALVYVTRAIARSGKADPQCVARGLVLLDLGEAWEGPLEGPCAETTLVTVNNGLETMTTDSFDAPEFLSSVVQLLACTALRA